MPSRSVAALFWRLLSMAVSTFHNPSDGDPFPVADAALKRVDEIDDELVQEERAEALAQHRYEFSL